jgi:hypothetical protein
MADLSRLMSLVDHHGSQRWATGIAEQAGEKRESAGRDKKAVEARAEIEAELTLLLDVVKAAKEDLDLHRNSHALRAALAAMEAAK